MTPLIYLATFNMGLAVAPFVLWAVPFLVAMLFFFRSSKHRNSISATSIMALLFGVAASSVILAVAVQVFQNDFLINMDYPPYHVFYGFYMAFTFIPALIAFSKLEKQEKPSVVGKCVVYLGFFWAAVIIATGLACTILSAVMIKAWEEMDDYDDFRKIFFMFGHAQLVLMYIGWGFILFQLILTIIYHKRVPFGAARRALYTYTIITTLQQTLYTIFITANLGLSDDSFQVIVYLTLFLVEVPIIISILIMFFTGHLWISQINSSVVIDDQLKLEQQGSLKSEQGNKLNFFSDFLRIISFS
ncbi:hypothetical protein MBANPS3_012317 [Mucor bainieri]